LYGGAPEQIETTINDGRNGVMPAWIDVLGKEGVATVAAYVRSLSGHETDNVTATKGKAIFEQNCAACHGADAKGTAAVGAPNLTDRTWLYGGSLSTVMRSIAQGRQGHMPAHREFLGEAKVHLLATYVYSLSQQQESR
jgi:cytochrome c oxidase cbb3-type subunit 3